jgi:phosphatidylserine/phosphatidylglycerophosphate/cardiolipin synthase-like enzyme/regulation of enolase protein 1 (concanavalin A-like superfamily)
MNTSPVCRHIGRASVGRLLIATLLFATIAGAARPARASERLCDPSFESCRDEVLTLIGQETVGIDVAFWFMDDSRYASAIIKRWQAGVPVRVLIDPRGDVGHPLNADVRQQLQDAGIPMRVRTASGILHWKTMLFAGQNIVDFGGANYSPYEYVPVTPYVNYTDEAILFSDDPAVVNSFKTKWDDLWTDTTNYADYANITNPPVRIYPTFPIDPDLNFPPGQDYANRAVGRYNLETQQIDVLMFRITDQRHTNAMLNAVARHVPVRLITEQSEYRDPTRLWDAWNVDRLYVGGVQIRQRAHEGLNHEKAVILYSEGMTIFGSSNWTTPSANSQQEHNYFTTKTAMFQWFVDQFNRKWNNTDPAGTVETEPFVPLPPDKPAYQTPANAASVSTSTATLTWYGGPWAHNYDIYFGTSATPPLVAANLNLGPSLTTTQNQTWTTPALSPGTTYYWQIVSKTMANLTAAGPVWSFTTPGTGGGSTAVPPPWLDADVGAVGIAGSASYNAGTFSVSGSGADIWGTADAFHFVYQSLTGDGQIVARVSSVGDVNAWAKAGVMIRETLSPGSAFAQMLVSAGKGTAFQYRTSSGASALNVTGTTAAAPLWIKIVKAGNVISGSQSADGTSWQSIGSATFTMASTVFVGLAVVSHTNTQLCTAAFDTVTTSGTSAPPPSTPASPAPATGANGVSTHPTLTWTSAGATSYDVSFGSTNPPPSVSASQTSASYKPPALMSSTQYFWRIVAHNAAGSTTGPLWTFTTAAGVPPPWQDLDIGAVGVAGSASYANGVFTVAGSGADIWNAADAFHFVYQPLNGDGQLVARVASIQHVNNWSKAGVMIRATLDANSAFAFMLVSAAKGTAFQYRDSTGGAANGVTGTTAAAPTWVKIVRAGDTITGYQSADGATWQMVGSVAIPMGTAVQIGLAVTSHDNTAAATATFDGVGQ